MQLTGPAFFAFPDMKLLQPARQLIRAFAGVHPAGVLPYQARAQSHPQETSTQIRRHAAEVRRNWRIDTAVPMRPTP